MSSPVHHYTVQLVLGEASRASARRVAESLASAGHPPTHWGPTRGIRKRFDLEELEAHAAAVEGTGALPILMRTARPRYECSLQLYGAKPRAVLLESQLDLEPDEHAAYFAIGLALAQWLGPVFGGVEPAFRVPPERGPDDPDPRMVYPPQWSKTGPHRVFARTFFGAPLAEILGADDWLGRAGLTIVHQGSGLLVVDALAEPWNASADACWRSVTVATRALAPSGLFARMGDRRRFVAGARWLPVAERS